MKKEKKYFDIKIEANVPTTIMYRVLAEDEEEALETVLKGHAIQNNVKQHMEKRKILEGKVYKGGTIEVVLTRKL